MIKKNSRYILLLLSLFSFVTYAEDASKKEPQVQLLAPGYGELDFEAPPAGTYNLPAIGSAKDATVIDVNGEPAKFHELFKDRYTLLTFMYTSCNDVNGCPLTHLVFNRIRAQANKEPGLSKYMQLISMSFDPKNDTPEVLKALSQGNAHAHHEGHGDHHEHHADHEMKTDESNKIPWNYFTSHSMEKLQPILEDYKQDVMHELDEDGNPSENFSHILRVFLIDPEFKIRNMYSVSFLHPDILINDVKTLLMDDNIVLESDKDIEKSSSIHNSDIEQTLAVSP